MPVLESSLTTGPPSAGWEDDALIAACLAGEQLAWNALIDKYKALVYSIPFRYGLDAGEAGDVFQDVCLTMYKELANVREAKALRGWLARIAANESYRRKLARARVSDDMPDLADPSAATPELLGDVERQQSVRNSVAQLGERCRRMMGLLFFEDPPRPYQEVAQQLGLAVGSIGFIRGRCLRQLEKLLREAGL